MPAERKPRRPKAKSLQHSLIAPLQHCALAGGSMVALYGEWAVSGNDVLTAGHPIVDNLEADAELEPLLRALTSSTEQVTIQKDTDRLRVASGDNVWWITCRELGTVTHVPDPSTIEAGAPLRDALSRVGSLLTDKAQQLLEAAALTVAGGSVIGTDYQTMIQAHTEVELPAGRLLPQSFIKALAKCPEPVSVGWGAETLTVYFENGSWLKTMCYRDVDVPDLARVLETEMTGDMVPFPSTLPDVCKALKPFAANGTVYFDGGAVRVIAANEQNAAVQPCPEAPGGIALKLEGVQALSGATHWGLSASRTCVMALGAFWRAITRLETHRPA